MTASLNRLDRQFRSVVNKAANRMCREEAAFAAAAGHIGRAWRAREAQLGRALLIDELELMCAEMSFADVLGSAQPRAAGAA